MMNPKLKLSQINKPNEHVMDLSKSWKRLVAFLRTHNEGMVDVVFRAGEPVSCRIYYPGFSDWNRKDPDPSPTLLSFEQLLFNLVEKQNRTGSPFFGSFSLLISGGRIRDISGNSYRTTNFDKYP